MFITQRCLQYICAVFVCISLYSAEPEDNAKIIVIGNGETREVALQEAFKEAVRQCVGSYIESSTMIQEEQILKEKIFEFSYGYVKSYDVVREFKNNAITISAIVSRQKLSKELRNYLSSSILTAKERRNLNIKINSDITDQRNQSLLYQRSERFNERNLNACKQIFEEYRSAFQLIYYFVPEKCVIGNINGITTETADENEMINITISGTIQTHERLYNLLLSSMMKKYEGMFQQKIDVSSARFAKNQLFAECKRNTGFAVAFKRNALSGPDYKIEGNLNVYYLNNIPFMNRVTPARRQKVEMQIYFVDENNNLIFPVMKKDLYPLRYRNLEAAEIISPYFDTELAYRDCWIDRYLSLKIEKTLTVPLGVARKISSTKGILVNNNIAGEELLNELL